MARTPPNAARAIAAHGPFSHMDGQYYPPTIETGRVTNVNMERWTIDAVSLFGNKRFEAVQVMSSYFHYANGEGIYCMPEVGALVWICKPSDGSMSKEFVMGFQAPFDTDNNSFRCNRQNLNPGDMMFRTRDENFVILRRGGVVQIGATPITQRLFIPVRNFIKDFCENYELHTLGGELSWLVDRAETDADGNQRAKVSLLAKEKANDPKQIATLTIGSHGEGVEDTLILTVFESGLDGAAMMSKLILGKDGTVAWQIMKTFTVTVTSDITLESTGGKISLKSAQDTAIDSGANLSVTAVGNIDMEAAMVKVAAQGNIDLEAAVINVGGAGATPAAKAVQTAAAFTALATACDVLLGGAATTAIQGILPGIPAQKAMVK